MAEIADHVFVLVMGAGHVVERGTVGLIRAMPRLAIPQRVAPLPGIPGIMPNGVI